MKNEIEQNMQDIFKLTEDDRQMMPIQYEDEYELDCKDRSIDIQNTFNTKID